MPPSETGRRAASVREPGLITHRCGGACRGPSGADLDTLDQKLDDPRLLGGEELIPERVELGEGIAYFRLGQIADADPAQSAMCRIRHGWGDTVEVLPPAELR